MVYDQSEISENIRYLKKYLDESKKLDIGYEKKECKTDNLSLAEVTIYSDRSYGPTVELTPVCWDSLSDLDPVKMYRYANEIIVAQRYECKLTVEDDFTKYGKKRFQMKVHMQGMPVHAIRIDAMAIKIHSKEGIKILQGLWERCL